MVVKVYISGISGNKEVKKRQQRVLMILDSKNIKYDIIDITEPGREADKDFMQNNAKSNGATVSDPNPRSPLPPQVFNDEEYCGDYDQFDLANEVDTLEVFLKVELPSEDPQPEKNVPEKTINGDVSKTKESKGSKEPSVEKESTKDLKETSVEKESTKGSKETSVEKESTKGSKETSLEKDATDELIEKERSPTKVEVSENLNAKSRSVTPAKDKSLSKEGSPIKDDTDIKEKSVEKDLSTQQQQSVETAENDNHDDSISKNILNEISEESVHKKSSTQSSLAKSQEEDMIEKKKDLSEAFIENEQAAASN